MSPEVDLFEYPSVKGRHMSTLSVPRMDDQWMPLPCPGMSSSLVKLCHFFRARSAAAAMPTRVLDWLDCVRIDKFLISSGLPKSVLLGS